MSNKNDDIRDRRSNGGGPAVEVGLRAPFTLADTGLPLRKVRKAYEQVADQIYALIVSGVLGRGDRLPTETELARRFGVSRATIREALRLLAAQRLIRTAKGSGGGSFVTVPSISSISDYLHSSIGVMTSAHDVALEEFLEARELFEVPAARHAAERQDPNGMRHIHDSIPRLSADVDTDEQFRYNKGFHSAIIEAAGNTLILIAAQPIFSVLQTSLARSELGEEFHRQINADHVEIADAIDRGDGDAASKLMHTHLDYLRPHYERVWPHAKRKAGP